MQAKAKVFILGSCVSRDIFDLTEKYEITEYVGRTSLASAFGDKSFVGPTDAQLEHYVESNWQRRCIRNDTGKQLASLLREQTYDVLVLDFIEERFKLIEYEGALATLSPELVKTGLHKTPGIKRMRPLNLKRMLLWKKGFKTLLAIAAEKNVPIILNEVYPAIFDNRGKPFHIWSVIREYCRLYWLYSQVPDYVIRVRVPKSTLTGDAGHKWGRSPFHYMPAAYQCLLKQLELQLEQICCF